MSRRFSGTSLRPDCPGATDDDASWGYDSFEPEDEGGLGLFGLLFVGIGLIVLWARFFG